MQKFRGEALTIIVTMLIGFVSMVYTFSTDYATVHDVDKIESRIERNMAEIKQDVRWIRNNLFKAGVRITPPQ